MVQMASASKMSIEDAYNITRKSSKLATELLPRKSGLEVRPDEKQLYVIFSADRGMCGSVSTRTLQPLSQHLRRRIAEGQTNFKILMISQRGFMSFSKVFADYILPSIGSTYGVKNMTAITGAVVVDEILKHDFDSALVVSPKFISSSSYDRQEWTIESPKKLGSMPEFLSQFTGTDLTGPNSQAAAEHLFGQQIFLFMRETAAVEVTARYAAMNGAVKACKDKVNLLRRTYNKTRQYKATKESRLRHILLVRFLICASLCFSSRVELGRWCIRRGGISDLFSIFSPLRF